MRLNLPPEVTLENYQAVYDYYQVHQQPRFKALAAYAHLARKYAPRVNLSKQTALDIKQIRDDNGSFLISVNHPTNHSDQFVLAGTAWRSPLRRNIGHMRVLGKDDLFIDKEQRKKVDMMGSIPVFRAKDHSLRAVSDAGKRMMDVCAERLFDGDDLAVFVQGEHESEHPEQIKKINSGIAHIALRALNLGTPLHMLSIGIAYDRPGDHPSVEHASVYINPPFQIDAANKPATITREVRDDLQTAVTKAHELY